MFHQDLYRVCSEDGADTMPSEQLCFRGKIELVCLVNGRLANSEDYDRAFQQFIANKDSRC